VYAGLVEAIGQLAEGPVDQIADRAVAAAARVSRCFPVQRG
jgi:hypothetical protein